MRKAGSALVVASLTALAVPLTPATALADSTSEAAATGAYFWKGKLPSTLNGQPNPANGQDTDADGVARDDLAVALVEQGPDTSNKETFLAWDLLELDLEATISKFVVTMPLSEKTPNPDPAQNTVQQREKEALLRACSPKEGWGAADAGAYEVKPEVDYATCVPGAYDPAANAYVFDVTALTSTWLTESNNGIAIVPDKPTEQAPFQVVFQPTAAHLAAIEYTPGAGADSLDDFSSDSLLDTSGSLSTSSDTSGGSGSSFLSSAPASSFGGSSSSGTALSPSIDSALPQTAEAPAGPEPEIAQQKVRTAPVAASVPSGPPVGFWLLGAVLGLVLLAMSLATGSPVTPAAAQARAGRVLARVQRMAATRSAT